MTLRLVIAPLYGVTCDADGCEDEIRDDWEWSTRRLAEKAGWQIRPRRGKGSRSAPDLCPVHRTDGGESR